MLNILLLLVIASTTIGPPPSDGLPAPKRSAAMKATQGPCKCGCGSPICRCADMGGCRKAVSDEAPPRRGYPTRASLWGHPGSIKGHLLSGEHSGKFDRDWINSLSNYEAESLHSDDHEGRVKWYYVVRPGQRMTASAERPSRAVYKTETRRVFSCVGGVCGWRNVQTRVFSHWE